MKILLISFSHHPTLQNYIYLLKKNMSAYDCDIYSLGNSNVGSLYETLNNSYFVDCIDSASPSPKNISLYFKKRKSIIRILKQVSPDVVLFTSKHIWNFFMLGYLRRKNIKVIHVFHDPIGHAGTTVGNGVIMYNKILAKMLNGIVVHSQISYENTIKHIKPKCPVMLTPLGEKIWIPYREPKIFQKKLLIFGRISTYKGCEFIAQIAERLKQKAIDCTIVVAGKCLDDVPDNFEKQLQNQSNIIFHNEFIAENELDDYFYSCDASLILHKSISQSGVIIDAYRHGHPLFCFAIDGISEFINDKTAFISNPFDVDSMVEQIERMYLDFDKYKEMSMAAYQFGSEKFSAQNMAKLIYELCTECRRNIE